jgi:hypothetical protein
MTDDEINRAIDRRAEEIRRNAAPFDPAAAFASLREGAGDRWDANPPGVADPDDADRWDAAYAAEVAAHRAHAERTEPWAVVALAAVREVPMDAGALEVAELLREAARRVEAER